MAAAAVARGTRWHAPVRMVNLRLSSDDDDDDVTELEELPSQTRSKGVTASPSPARSSSSAASVAAAAFSSLPGSASEKQKQPARARKTGRPVGAPSPLPRVLPGTLPTRSSDDDDDEDVDDGTEEDEVQFLPHRSSLSAADATGSSSTSPDLASYANGVKRKRGAGISSANGMNGIVKDRLGENGDGNGTGRRRGRPKGSTKKKRGEEEEEEEEEAPRRKKQRKAVAAAEKNGLVPARKKSGRTGKASKSGAKGPTALAEAKYRPEGWPEDDEYTHTMDWSEVPRELQHWRLDLATAEQATAQECLEIRKITHPEHPCCDQHGLFARRSIEKEVQLCDYAGVVHVVELNPNQKPPPPADDYSCELRDTVVKKPDGTEQRLLIEVDASNKGNESKFINDYGGIADAPNVTFDPYYCRWSGEIRVGVFTLRAIKKGEELVFDYGDAFRAILESERKNRKSSNNAKRRSTKPPRPPFRVFATVIYKENGSRALVRS